MSVITDFYRGLKVIFGKPREGEGDRKLAQMSEVTMALIPQYGKDAVRKQLIKSMDKELKRYAKKGTPYMEAKIQLALATPEYMKLLRKLDLDESHIRVLAREATKCAVSS